MNFLNLNPYFRLTAYECLINCKVFDSVRDKKKEAILDHITKVMSNNKQPLAKNKRSRLTKASKTTSVIISKPIVDT